MKKRIAQILKDLKVGLVKMSPGDYGPFKPRKTFKTWEGQTVKGIEGGSHGPMTCTSAHLDHNRTIEAKVRAAFRDIATEIKDENGFLRIKVDIGNKRMRELTFSWDQFPSYTRSADLDPSYKTYWFVLTVKDSKI